MSQGEHTVNVMGRKSVPLMGNTGDTDFVTFIASGADMSIGITRSLINLAKIENKLSKPLAM